jgi:phosphopantothenoylcysteine decarboxylase/phosphopantothenate--cysteine ligase
MSEGKPVASPNGALADRRTVLLGVTGSIAAYKALDLAGRLRRRGINVVAAMTGAACRLVGPASFESITGNPVARELFPENKPQTIEHIALAELADAVAVVPATANFLAKAAHGLADDLLTAAVLATKSPKLAAPAMNVGMWQNRVVQGNLKKLKAGGWQVVEPEEGFLACGTRGAGRLARVEIIEQAILDLLGRGRDLAGVPVLITAGRTEEPWDPVRFLSNRSSGRMGFALARAAREQGAEVTLIAGPADIAPPAVDSLIRVRTAGEMRRAVMRQLPGNRALIMAAAVADYRPRITQRSKIKRSGGRITLELAPNPDIVAEAAGKRKKGTVVVGFALETGDLRANALKKLRAKGLDLIVANDARALGSSSNRGWLFFAEGRSERVPETGKDAFAKLIIDRLVGLLKRADG